MTFLIIIFLATSSLWGINLQEEFLNSCTERDSSVCTNFWETHPGLNINYKSPRDGWTALHTATYCGNSEIVQFLINNGAQNLWDKDGMTPLYMAARARDVENLRIILTVASDDDKRRISHNPNIPDEIKSLIQEE
jgi:ankyrin repeat protein